MLTAYDVQALIDLLQRTPMTKPEQLFAGRLVETLMTMTDAPDAPEADGEKDASGDAPERP